MGKMGEGSHRVPEGWSLLPSHLIATPCLLPSSLCTPRPCLALSLCPTLSSLLLSSQGHSVLFIFLNNLFGLVEAAVVCSVVVCRLSCPKVCGILVPRPGIKPMFPALEGWFAATGLAGKSPRSLPHWAPYHLLTGCPLKTLTRLGDSFLSQMFHVTLNLLEPPDFLPSLLWEEVIPGACPQTAFWLELWERLLRCLSALFFLDWPGW